MKQKDVIILVIVLAFLAVLGFMALRARSPVTNSIGTVGGGGGAMGGGLGGSLADVLGSVFNDGEIEAPASTTAAGTGSTWDMASNRAVFKILNTPQRNWVTGELYAGRPVYTYGLDIPRNAGLDWLIP